MAEVLLKLQDIADAPFDRDQFALQLIEAYGAPKATLAKLRQGEMNKTTVDGDLIWQKRLHVRPSASGGASATLDAVSAEWRGKKSAAEADTRN
jgi:hypothetical protein